MFSKPGCTLKSLRACKKIEIPKTNTDPLALNLLRKSPRKLPFAGTLVMSVQAGLCGTLRTRGPDAPKVLLALHSVHSGPHSQAAPSYLLPDSPFFGDSFGHWEA